MQPDRIERYIWREGDLRQVGVESRIYSMLTGEAEGAWSHWDGKLVRAHGRLAELAIPDELPLRAAWKSPDGTATIEGYIQVRAADRRFIGALAD